MEATATLADEAIAPALLSSLRDLVDGVEAAEQMVAVAMAWRTRMIEQAAAWAELAAIDEQRIGRRDPQGWSPDVVARRTVSSELAVALRVPERTAENRCVTVEPAQDGMAYLTAYLPVEQAVGIHSRLTDLAYELRRAAPDDTRTLVQLRSDALTDLLVDGIVPDGPRNPGIRATVFVTVPALTLLDRGDVAGDLDGYGPIGADAARELAAHAPSFTRILTHPESGAVLSVGRTSYAVPADLKAWLRVRDGTCRFPGCRASTRHADLDHTIDWQHDGETRHDNLAHLCRPHHTLKHRRGWSPRQVGGGVLEWRSPSGRAVVSRPSAQTG